MISDACTHAHSIARCYENGVPGAPCNLSHAFIWGTCVQMGYTRSSAIFAAIYRYKPRFLKPKVAFKQ
eukprot:6184418-Pleurochrysis_carterae.AAC.1